MMRNRTPWDVYFMRIAYLTATRATCDRRHVGAVVVDPYRRIVATGYNGAPAGTPHCDEVGHEIVEGHCIRTLHAESNAIDYAGRDARFCTIYITASPCYDCAKRIVSVGISRVVFHEMYTSRYNASARMPEFLKASGVEIENLVDPSMTQFVTLLAKEWSHALDTDQEV